LQIIRRKSLVKVKKSLGKLLLILFPNDDGLFSVGSKERGKRGKSLNTAYNL